VISESVLLVKHLVDKREDTVHVDYVRPYYSRDGSPAIGKDATFPKEEDDRSKDIVYDTRILYDEHDDSNVFEVESRADPDRARANKVADYANSNDNRRITRSRARMLQGQASAESGTLQQSTGSTTTHASKQPSLLNRARARVKKIMPKRVSFSPSTSRKSSSSNTSVHVNDNQTSSGQDQSSSAATSANPPSSDPTTVPNSSVN
jgi:hypothetical protein